jgi:pyruvate kinase
MIARGDLAAEIGFERLVEVQKEILRICVAASVSGEMTDAAMASRAECGLNKGPAIGAAIELLDRLLSRIDTHVFKKTARLRALKSW